MKIENNQLKCHKSTNQSDDLVYVCGWNRMMMRIIGGWPEDDDNFIMKNRAYINVTLITCFILLPQIGSLTVFWGDFDAFMDCLGVCLGVTVALIKAFWLRIQRSTVHRLLDLMAKDWLLEKTAEEREEMTKLVKIIRIFSTMSFYTTASLWIAHITSHILLGFKLKNDPNVDPRISIGLLYESVFPFDTSSLFVFIPIWIIQFFMTYVSIANYSSPDVFLGILIVHQCSQLKILRRRLENIVNKLTISDTDKFWEKLIELIERHEHLNKRTMEIEEKFNFIILIVIMFFVIAFCTQCFALLTMLQEEGGIPGAQIVHFAVFLAFDLAHLFVYCWTGDLLMTESSDIGISLYNSMWYDLAPSESQSLLILNSRCTIPQQITGGNFFAVSLPLFASIIKTTVSYLSVLLTIKM